MVLTFLDQFFGRSHNMVQPLLLPKSELVMYAYDIPYSAKIANDDPSFMSVTPSSDNSAKQWTLSTWFKIGVWGTRSTDNNTIMHVYNDASNSTYIAINSSDKLSIYHYVSDAYVMQYVSNFELRDNTNWYHLCVVHDSELGTAADRVKIYINGVRMTDWDTENTQTVDLTTDLFSDVLHLIGKSNGGQESNMYLADYHAINGYAKAVTDFGTLKNGVWVPKRYTGLYGTGGFYLDFSNPSDFGEDQSGGSNDFTDSGLATDDQLIDSPTHNYCTLNTADRSHDLANNPISEGSLKVTRLDTNDWMTTFGTWNPQSGKWYCEVKIVYTTGTGSIVGVCSELMKHNRYAGYPGGSSGYGSGYKDNGYGYLHGAGTAAMGDSYTTDDIIGMAYDRDGDTIDYYKNNVHQFQHDLSAKRKYNSGYYFGVAGYTTNVSHLLDFGQSGFAYTPPSGYLAMCSTNLDEPTIFPCNQGADAILYTGDGNDARDIGGLEFQPDLVLIKQRHDSNTNPWVLNDSVRGVNTPLAPDDPAAEGSTTYEFPAFNVDGFQIGATDGVANIDLKSYIAYCLKMGPEYGFDIQTYEGTGVAQNIAHDLGAEVEMMIIKNRDNSGSWAFYHRQLGYSVDPENDYLRVDTNNGTTEDLTVWDATNPDDSVFRVGTSSHVNTNNENYIAYLFRSILGFSRVYAYWGNGNADGFFFGVGFHPKFIIQKTIASSVGWTVFDSVRDEMNDGLVSHIPLHIPSYEINTLWPVDLYCSGWRPATTRAEYNGATLLVGIAFAHLPFKYSNAR